MLCQMFYNVTNPGMTVQQGDILVCNRQLHSRDETVAGSGVMLIGPYL